MPTANRFLLLTILLLTACSSVVMSSAPTSIVNSTPTTSLLSVTSTIIPSQPISAATSTASQVTVVCAEIGKVASEASISKSNILFQDKTSNEVYLWSIDTAEKDLIDRKENEILRDFFISPNGEWLVLIRSTQDGIVTTHSQLELWSWTGELRKTISVDIGMYITRWLNNQQLLLSHGQFPRSRQFVLNPFTGEKEDLDLTFSDLYDLPIINNQWGNALIYDPNLTRVVYAGSPADIVMADVKSKEVITRISPAPIPHVMPKWSPDGQQVAIVYADTLDPINDPVNWVFELYSISRDGQFNQLTNLSGYYDHPRIRYFNWSPNGQYIAFWLETDPSQRSGVYELAVLDLKTNKVTNYCIKNGPNGQTPAIYWSPDSAWLAFDVVYDSQNKDVLAVDVLNGKAVQIGKNLDFLGWTVTP